MKQERREGMKVGKKVKRGRMEGSSRRMKGNV